MGCSSSSPDKREVYFGAWSDRVSDFEMFGEEKLVHPTLLPPSEFVIDRFVGEGGMATVYGARVKKSGEKVALKIFGYTLKKPQDSVIQREIDILTRLVGLEGVVQIRGIFMDSMMGMSEVHGNKVWKLVYPVIVMEFIDGGALYDRVHRNKFMSEKILKQIFVGFLEGLRGIHSRGFVHRDLKLENIMLEAYGDDLMVKVKIIDLGMMVHLPQGGKHIADKICGTRGYIAPESLIQREYSVASDIWQVGCVLYSMLSGLLPFHPDHVEQSYHGKYYPMTGPVWSHISDSAKDLVKRLLVVKPSWRLTLSDILKHSWLTQDASDVNLGPSYARRIKCLALRNKMRNFFVANEEMLSHTRIRPENIKDFLPFLKVRGKCQYSIGGDGSSEERLPSVVGFTAHKETEESKASGFSDANSKNANAISGDLASNGSGVGNAEKEGKEFNRSERLISLSHDISVRTFKLRLHDVQTLIGQDLQSVVEDSSNRSLGQHVGSSEAETDGQDTSGGEMLANNPQALSFTLPAGEIDFETFEDVLTRAGLEGLATPGVFNLFDIGSKGTINLREFLVAMLAVQPGGVEARGMEGSDEDETVRMFFRMFDIDNSGAINREEFKLALEHLSFITPHALQNDEGEGDANIGDNFHANVDELFREMDVSGDGSIQYEEFKKFYEEVMRASLSTSTTMMHSILCL